MVNVQLAVLSIVEFRSPIHEFHPVNEAQPPIALGVLLLAELVTVLFLLQHKQQVFLPIVLQTARDFLLARLHPPIAKRS